ncbi:MAG TPA: cation transporter [Thermotogota bacterium]|nr:cation transporter [Thermotogota bacterium]HRW34890.1 cation transporter [Thermotogota bacterium]
MVTIDKASAKREKTMLVAFLLSSPGPLLTGIAALSSQSATQIADFLRRSSELVALFVAWWVFRKMQRDTTTDQVFQNKMSRIANLTVSIAMICSGIAMFIVGVIRLFVFNIGGKVILGLVIAVLGLITNSWFWWRYWSMNREIPDSVIEGQRNLYRAKSCVDIAVVSALTAVLLAPNHPATQYVDAVGCMIVAFYLFYSGAKMMKQSKQADIEKTVS